MQSWIRDLIDLKTQISVLQNCMHAASQQLLGGRPPTPTLAVRRQFSGGLPPIFVMLIVALPWE
jgi:hypothetical protein